MRRQSVLDHARNEGSLAAARELRRLRISQNRAVDVFRAIIDANLWLLFQPLDDLLGVFVPEGGGGILVNTRRPQSVQRLTAAHEYGHYVLKHDVSLDDRDDIEDLAASRQVEEAAAKAFAADFLMPPQLVNHLQNELCIPQDMRPYHAYLLALFMGTSYQSTIYQLASQGKLPAYRAREMLQVTPKQIKQEIGRGIGPSNPWAEVWPIDESQTGQDLIVAVEDEISVSLSETPSSGFVWLPRMEGLIDLRDDEQRIERHRLEIRTAPPQDDEGSPVALIRSEFDSANHSQGEEIGGQGNRYVAFRALKGGECELRLSLQRPWQTGVAPSRTFTIKLRVKHKPTGDANQGYLEEAKTTDLALHSRAA